MNSSTQRIARKAANLSRKPNKPAAFDIVLSIIESYGATDEQLADLYAFFLPPVTKIKSPFHWLVRARGDKDVRYYLNHVYSDGKKTMATDGHRAHVINEKRPAGWYDDNDQIIQDPAWATYPDVMAVLPCKGVGITLKIKELPIHTVSDKVFLYVMPDGFGMNKKYVDEACGLSPDYVLTYFTDSTRCRVVYDNAEAVIMGRRIT
ncbi:MAG: hypothetical protein KAS93_06710 [Gammaproteobacteria bacterium]|nr:hypothetical protein [Gammaproteobacteria bacterium]